MSKSTVNFTPADILTAMKEGQRAVWKKLPAIKARWRWGAEVLRSLVQLRMRAPSLPDALQRPACAPTPPLPPPPCRPSSRPPAP